MLSEGSSLIFRLKNCLTTILELEDELRRSDLGELLQEEFATLKQVLVDLPSISVREDDVYRIETATVRFLEEIKSVLQEHATYRPASRLLQ